LTGDAETIGGSDTARQRKALPWRTGWAILALLLAGTLLPVPKAIAETSAATARELARQPIRERHLDTSREEATSAPRREADQAIVDGWPLYRSRRGQQAFNEAMATLAATSSAAPPASRFAGCPDLACRLDLPRFDADGWLPPGRIWLSPTEYVLLVRSPRLAEGRSYRRHSPRRMRIFVFHEFLNSSRNTDPYDTISSHDGSVFVSFYMGKQGIDAAGLRYVAVIQAAPVDVVSVHATNLGSAGPGIEVAKNTTDELQQLQARAGILVAEMVKAAHPRLEVVNHRGDEGRPMLEAYDERREKLDEATAPRTLRLPFTPAEPSRLAGAAAALGDLIRRDGVSPGIPLHERALVASMAARAGTAPQPTQARVPAPVLVRSATPRPVASADNLPAPAPRLVEPVRPANGRLCTTGDASGRGIVCWRASN